MASQSEEGEKNVIEQVSVYRLLRGQLVDGCETCHFEGNKSMVNVISRSLKE